MDAQEFMIIDHFETHDEDIDIRLRKEKTLTATIVTELSRGAWHRYPTVVCLDHGRLLTREHHMEL